MCISKSVHWKITTTNSSLFFCLFLFLACTYTHWAVISSTGCVRQPVCWQRMCLMGEGVTSKIIHIGSTTHSHVWDLCCQCVHNSLYTCTPHLHFSLGCDRIQRSEEKTATTPSTRTTKWKITIYFASFIVVPAPFSRHVIILTISVDQNSKEKPTNETVRPQVMHVLVCDPKIFVSFCFCGRFPRLSMFNSQL